MRRPFAWIVGAVVILIAIAAVFLIAKKKPAADAAEDAKGQAYVTLTPVKTGAVEDVVAPVLRARGAGVVGQDA